MDKAPFYRQFYEQAGIAEEDVGAEERIPVTLAMIPADVSSILDVGCGDGTFLSSMDSPAVKVGIDISHATLRLVKTGHRVLASSDILPFRENGFDLVVSTEVLEHLPPVVFEASCGEMQRVAKRHILISVPFHEDLAGKQARCPRCEHVYHIHHHVRSFDLSVLEKTFPDCCLREYRFSGPQERTFPPWLLKIRREYGRRWEWDKNALCPQCGYRSNRPPARSVISAATSFLAGLTGKRHPKWVSALYEKK